MLEQIGFVVIGRNEGERLKRCLGSMPEHAPIVYVDSGSTDGSVEWARQHGAEVVQLDLGRPFTAARARNIGFRTLKAMSPGVELVQFIDGDCELAAAWPEKAGEFLSDHPPYCAVFGRRRERFPRQSIYNALCDIEWNVPIGESRSFGGDVLIRADAFESVGGYRDDLIAGEEPEMCVRLRAKGWKIWRLDQEMTLHDAAILRFPQWWRRTMRSGYAFAQGAHIHGAPPEKHWVWESRRALIWGLVVPLVCLCAGFLVSPWGHLLWLTYPIQIMRRIPRVRDRPPSAVAQATFGLLSRFPEAVGQLKYLADRITHTRRQVIDYK